MTTTITSAFGSTVKFSASPPSLRKSASLTSISNSYRGVSYERFPSGHPPYDNPFSDKYESPVPDNATAVSRSHADALMPSPHTSVKAAKKATLDSKRKDYTIGASNNWEYFPGDLTGALNDYGIDTDKVNRHLTRKRNYSGSQSRQLNALKTLPMSGETGHFSIINTRNRYSSEPYAVTEITFKSGMITDVICYGYKAIKAAEQSIKDAQNQKKSLNTVYHLPFHPYESTVVPLLNVQTTRLGEAETLLDLSKKQFNRVWQKSPKKFPRNFKGCNT